MLRDPLAPGIFGERVSRLGVTICSVPPQNGSLAGSNSTRRPALAESRPIFGQDC